MSTGRPISKRLSVGLEADGSPVQLRTAPPPNRVLDFGESEVHKSIESASPFKPRHVLRRSMGGVQKNPFASPEPARDAKPKTIPEAEEEAQDEVEEQQTADDGPLMVDDDDYYDAVPEQEEASGGAEEVEEDPAPKKRGRPRKSGESRDTSQVHHTPPVADMTSGQKRDRSTLEAEPSEEANVSHSQITEAGPASKKHRGRPAKVIVHQDDGDAYTIDPSLLAHGDEYVAEVSEEPSEAPNKGKGKEKGKKSKAAAPKERDPNRKMDRQVRINDSPSKLRSRSKSQEASGRLSVGPISNVHLRASTPFEDASERTSRYGRNLIQPLKYWANEMRIYKHGETAGIVRADMVSPPKRTKPPPKKRGRKVKGGKLDDIEEESDTESTHPDEWEEEVGVIAGMVANWDPENQVGVPEDLVREGKLFTPLLTSTNYETQQTDSLTRLQISASPPPPS